MAGTALNYEYVLQRALSATSADHPRILDYGSGQGQLIALARSRNVDIYGVDVPGIEVTDRVQLIDKDGRIPHPDNSFDVVVSNQVFEHVADPPVALAEIHRALKPGGVFIALFPDVTVWFEGHRSLLHSLAATVSKIAPPVSQGLLRARPRILQRGQERRGMGGLGSRNNAERGLLPQRGGRAAMVARGLRRPCGIVGT